MSVQFATVRAYMSRCTAAELADTLQHQYQTWCAQEAVVSVPAYADSCIILIICTGIDVQTGVGTYGTDLDRDLEHL